jgi:hypothetical protein
MSLAYNPAFSLFADTRIGVSAGWPTGLPDFSLHKIPKRENIYQITTKYTKCPLNIPNYYKICIPDVRKIYQQTAKWTKCP